MPQYELNLREYWQVIEKRWFILVIIFLAVQIATGIYTNSQKPLYQAVSSVQWNENKTFANLLLEFFNINLNVFRAGDPLVTQSKIITSLPVLERVVKDIGLVNTDASPDEIRGVAASIQGRISTSVVTGSNIINIIVTHGKPQIAAKIANRVAEVYIDEDLKEKSKQSRTVREFIEKQLVEISAKLKTAEEQLAKFKEIKIPSGVALPLQDKLANLEAERQSLLQKFTAIHPDIKDIEEQIMRLKEQLKTLPKKELEYSRLNREVDINARLYNELKDKLQGARIAEAEKVGDVTLIEPAAVPVAPISPHKLPNYCMGTMIGLMLGLSVTFLLAQLDTTIGTIEDVESYVKVPALGVIPYLRTPETKESFLQRLWPKQYKGQDKILHLRSQLLLNYPSSSTVFEAYRILRTNIQTEVFNDNVQNKVILFTSSGPEEGKSITVANLAIVMAQGGLRTLLIDGDLRRAVIHKIFGVKNEPGLSDILTGAIDPKDTIKTFTDLLVGGIEFNKALETPGLDNLNILPCGSSTSIPAELLASPQMMELLKKMKEKYSLILIDSPPVLAVADAIILSSKADGVILVYRVGKTARSVIFRSKTQLVESGAQVKGVILNNISPQMEMRYGYQYHYKYYGKYYTVGVDETKKKKEHKG